MSAWIADSAHMGMGTVMTHRAYGKHAEPSLRAVEEEAHRIERLLSRFLPDSEISRINRTAGGAGILVSDDTWAVLEQAVRFSSRCQGCFDVTIAPLAALWQEGRDRSRPPEQAAISRLLPLVNYRDLVLDPCKKTAGLRRKGQSVDLGGIGKGFAGDKFVNIFTEYGVTSAFSNIGGNVVALGTKPDGSPWQVGIRHPRMNHALIGSVAVSSKAVVTSGDYMRCFAGPEGYRYHHILNPSTGYPSDSGLVSVTVVADSSTTADALSTILFLAGMEKGLALLRGFPGTGAVLVDKDLLVHVTPDLKERFRAAESIRTVVWD
ncbi:FAD:protein FMN transferase [Gorillibacterium sp. sgz5001074]|uniref:FAD:protein FMN transferase n=1 Tax=Gorillibacterium sp. sgz5001074 TaxID=3446695 RepID=UPI003F66F0AC